MSRYISVAHVREIHEMAASMPAIFDEPFSVVTLHNSFVAREEEC